MALGFSPLDTKVEGGEIMTDFEIISVVIMTISLVLKAIKFGRDDNDKKKKKIKHSRYPAPTGDGFTLDESRGEEPDQKRHPFLPLL